MKLRAADLFCGAGGAAMGLHRAGFEVVGWDRKVGLAYPFQRHICDALSANLSGFDFVWASPPCQKHCAFAHLHKKEYECFISPVREKLKAWGGPYIIENVPGAPLLNPVQLCGSWFGLRVRRHRMFESNIALRGVDCRHRRKDDHGGNCHKPHNIKEAQDAIGIDWMNRAEIAQAIPPAYSEFLGKQVLAALTA